MILSKRLLSIFAFAAIWMASSPAGAASALAIDGDCAKKLSRLDFLVADYASFARDNNSSGAQTTYQEISNLMFQQTDSKNPCRRILMTKYLIDSVSDVHEAASAQGTDGNFSMHSLFAQGPRISNLILGLFRQHKIEFLTEDFRLKHRGHWLDKVSETEYETLGAYDCKETKIYIDPTLRPLDMALTMFHELDHLARDKTTNGVSPDFILNGKTDWNAYALDDEVSAITYTAAAQADLKNMYYSNAIKWAEKHPFNVSGDLTQFSDHGIFSSIFSKNHSKEHCTDAPMWVHFAIPIAIITIPLECHLYIKSTESDTSVANRLYTGDSKGTQDKEAFSLQATFEKVRQAVWSAYFPSASVGTLPPTPSHPHTGMNLITWFGSYPAEQDGVLLTTQVSTMCALYDQDLASGRVSDYLGSEYESADAISGSSSIHPCIRFHSPL